VHFQFSDYGKLTVIGVIIACAGWPVVTRVSSQPRWLFLRLAIAVVTYNLLVHVAPVRAASRPAAHRRAAPADLVAKPPR
jgi:hypothetical protein